MALILADALIRKRNGALLTERAAIIVFVYRWRS
jgi:hypothetical protein